MSPIDELPRSPAMRITGLAKGSKAKAIKVWNPTLLVTWAFDLIQGGESRKCGRITFFDEDETTKGSHRIELRWNNDLDSVEKRIINLKETIERVNAQPLEIFATEILNSHQYSVAEKDRLLKVWDDNAAKLEKLRRMCDRLFAAHLVDELSQHLLSVVQGEIRSTEKYLNKYPREERVQNVQGVLGVQPDVSPQALEAYRLSQVQALQNQLQQDEELLMRLKKESKAARRKIFKYLRQIVAVETA